MNEERPGTEGTARRSKGTRLPYLKDFHTSRFLTQEQLSKMSGVARTTIYRLEGGERAAHPRTAWRLALTLGVDPEELVHGRSYTWWY